MIVKNESKIIQRLLESVYHIIDYYCICDTGSTDNTVDIIIDFFKEKNIQGKIVYEPFQNFEHNRNYALKACLGLGDYILLLDADMKLQVVNFKKEILHSFDAIYIYQENSCLIYKNLRIVRNNGLFYYKGVTHEYIVCPNNTINGQLDKKEMFIMDIGDGGSKSNKSERDIQLLLKGIENEPKNDRYHFYLANSYHDSRQYDKAIEMYKKRIELNGWNQEVWYSYYRIGNIYKNTGQIEKAIYYWLLGYNFYSDRIENLYSIVCHYRIEGKHKLAKMYYDIAVSILDKKINYNEFLFTEYNIYTYKLYIEYTIIAYYLGIKHINDKVIIILNHCKDENEINLLFSNMKFYKNVLIQKDKKILDYCFKYTIPTFTDNCEKNDVYYKDSNNNNNIIRQWYPLHICQVNENNELNIIEKKETPLYFSRFRGSTNGFQYNDEIWFITHIISDEVPQQHYYHVFSVFDKDMNLSRYSAPFSFEGEAIEYCSSIIVEKNQVFINYSTWDKTTRIGIYEKYYINSLLKYI